MDHRKQEHIHSFDGVTEQPQPLIGENVPGALFLNNDADGLFESALLAVQILYGELESIEEVVSLDEGRGPHEIWSGGLHCSR